MSNPPEVPDEFDSEQELKDYIDQLHDEIEWLQREVEESEKEKLKLKQQLNELQSEGLTSNRSTPEIKKFLEEVREHIQEKQAENPAQDLNEVGGEVNKLGENRRSFKEKNGKYFESAQETQGNKDSTDSDEEKEKSLADKVAEYENSGGTGSGPGDHR